MTSPGPPPRIWPVIIATFVGTAILLGLGAWQVKRLAWKEALIAQLSERAANPPVDLTSAAALVARGQDAEFLRIRFSGRYLHPSAMKMIATYEGGQGWTIITPVVSDDGWAVLVDRGRVPAGSLPDITTPGGVVEITGVLRIHDGVKGYFDPDNDPAGNLWHWWDVQAMLKAGQFPPGLKPFPAVVQDLPQQTAADYPRPDQPKAKLANNHLGYAITWFGLAATLVFVSGFYVRDLRRRRKPQLDGADHGG
ncbi:SURF1 family protein [Aestuariivirga sp.]|jgi:surfeit locus 1 family protein|uniref:SURF1 family protein n=1 Tax=Aestuariivirga sp. TaxID=2650926 RepID=UPI0037852864